MQLNRGSKGQLGESEPHLKKWREEKREERENDEKKRRNKSVGLF